MERQQTIVNRTNRAQHPGGAAGRATDRGHRYQRPGLRIVTATTIPPEVLVAWPGRNIVRRVVPRRSTRSCTRSSDCRSS